MKTKKIYLCAERFIPLTRDNIDYPAALFNYSHKLKSKPGRI